LLALPLLNPSAASEFVRFDRERLSALLTQETDVVFALDQTQEPQDLKLDGPPDPEIFSAPQQQAAESMTGH
jgi:hypothetical protein